MIQNSEVYTLSATSPLTNDQLISKYPSIFGERVGYLEGEYHIHLNSDVNTVQHAPKQAPIALWERLQETLDDLIEQDILAEVTEPTLWVNLVVVVSQKDGKLCLCLDP